MPPWGKVFHNEIHQCNIIVGISFLNTYTPLPMKMTMLEYGVRGRFTTHGLRVVKQKTTARNRRRVTSG